MRQERRSGQRVLGRVGEGGVGARVMLQCEGKSVHFTFKEETLKSNSIIGQSVCLLFVVNGD